MNCKHCNKDFEPKRVTQVHCTRECGRLYNGLRRVHNNVSARTPKQRYCRQRHHAKARGIEFLFTFEEWWDIWKDKFHLRGRSRYALCMARHGDKGADEVGNVALVTLRDTTI